MPTHPTQCQWRYIMKPQEFSAAAFACRPQGQFAPRGLLDPGLAARRRREIQDARPDMEAVARGPGEGQRRSAGLNNSVRTGNGGAGFGISQAW